MTAPTDPVPHELAELLEAERTAPVSDAAARTAVRAKVAATVGHAPLGAAAGLGATGKLVCVLVLVAAGAGTAAYVRHGSRGDAAPPNRPVAEHVEPAAARVELAPPSPIPVPVRGEPSPPAAPPAQIARVTPSEDPPTAPEAPSQARLLRDAWDALSAGNAQHALDLVDDDLRAHPGGALAEERAALRVVALARSGRLDDARAAAADFTTRYPASVHRTLIDRALAGKDLP